MNVLYTNLYYNEVHHKRTALYIEDNSNHIAKQLYPNPHPITVQYLYNAIFRSIGTDHVISKSCFDGTILTTLYSKLNLQISGLMNIRVNRIKASIYQVWVNVEAGLFCWQFSFIQT